MIFAVPKPKKGKRKRAKNNPMPTAEDICTYPGCRIGYAHLHEDFGGKNRQLSIEYGFQRRLCYEHHNMPGGMNPHHNKDIAEQYKREAQAKFEKLYGTREDFIRLFGRNYLDTV
jgi:hypothetical protein